MPNLTPMLTTIRPSACIFDEMTMTFQNDCLLEQNIMDLPTHTRAGLIARDKSE